MKKSLLLPFLLLFAFSFSAFAQMTGTGVFDVRLVLHEIDCQDSTAYVDLLIKANSQPTQFALGGQNYRLSFNRNALANPRIDQELLISGNVNHPGGGGNSLYLPHTTNGSQDTICVVNVSYAFGGGFPLNHTNWVPVTRVAFDIVKFNTCAHVWWHTQDPVDFPPTTITEVVGFFEPPTQEGNYFDLDFCTYDSCTLISFPSQCGKDNHEPNNTLMTASSLGGGIILGIDDKRICPSGDVDMFTFNQTLPGRDIRVKLNNPPNNYDLELLNASGTVIASSHNPGFSTEKMFVPNAPVGTYYVRVYGVNGAYHPVLSYDLLVNQNQKPAPGGIGTKPPISGGITLKAQPVGAYLNAYPNPATQWVNLELGGVNGTTSVEVLDINGRRVLSRSFETEMGPNNFRIELSGLSEGTYLLQARNGETFLREKLVIIHE